MKEIVCFKELTTSWISGYLVVNREKGSYLLYSLIMNRVFRFVAVKPFSFYSLHDWSPWREKGESLMAEILHLRCRYCGEKLTNRNSAYCTPCNQYLNTAASLSPTILRPTAPPAISIFAMGRCRSCSA